MNEYEPRNDERLLDQAIAGLKSRTIPAFPHPTVAFPDHAAPPTRSSGRARRYAGALTGIAVAAGIVLAMVLLPRPGGVAFAWEDVLQSVRGKPWVHAVWTTPDGKQVETWDSHANGLAALKSDDALLLDDLRTGTRWEYRPGDATLYRAALPEELTHIYAESSELLAAIFRGQETEGTNRLEVLDQKQRPFREGGRDWLEFDVTLRWREGQHESKCKFRVDPATRLPHSGTIAATSPTKAGGRQFMQVRYDYPNRGPLDVYTLGLSRETEVVDRIPSADVQHLVAGMRAARQRFDDYEAVVVESLADQHWSRPTMIYRVWRDGNRWRLDQWHNDGAVLERTNEIEPPADDANAQQWWFERANAEQFIPVLLSDGKDSFRFKIDYTPVDEQGRFQVKSVAALPDAVPLNEQDAMPAIIRPFAEFQSHPPLGIPSVDSQATVHPRPASGPDGCALVEVRFQNRQPRANSNDLMRVWIDPLRNYVAMKWQMIHLDDDKEQVLQESEVVQLQRSPDGQWYPTEIRIGARGVIRYYLNFDAEIKARTFDVDSIVKREENARAPQDNLHTEESDKDAGKNNRYSQ